jgi:TolA-binding protein
MKRHFLSLCLASAALLPLAAPAQDITSVAEREQNEERHRAVTARLDRIEETQQSYQKRLNDLREENSRLRNEIDKLKNKNESAATQEALKKLEDAILEVDKKRQSDNERTLKALRELEKLILEKPPTRPRASDAATGGNTKPPTDSGRSTPEKPTTDREKGYEYSIRANDTLSGIVVLLRGQGLSVTQKQIIDANPAVNWNKLKIGQKIFIPAP